MVWWLLVGVILVYPQPAFAQERGPTPSAGELWKEYPLHASPTPTADETRVAPSVRRASAPAGDGGGGTLPFLLLGAAGVALVLAGSMILRRRDRQAPARSPRAARPPTPVLLAASSVAAMVPDERQHAPRLTAVPAEPVERRDEPAGGLHPPDPGQPWSAELEWQDTGGGPRFRLIARPAGGGTDALIAESEPLAWPPRDATAVRQMRSEVARLEAALRGAGWAPLPPGTAWYSKRFAWAPVTEPVSTGRFKRATPWPAGSKQHWRCELRWQPGYVNSRFTAVALEPGERKGVTVGASGSLKWLFMGDPNPRAPEQQAELSRLDEQLLAAGWEPAGRGHDWFALRYVWRHEGPPPDVGTEAETSAGGHDGKG